MANELPPVSSCEETPEADPTGKCYTIKEAIPVCANTNPASSLKSSDCTRLDNTYDQILQAAVVPSVGSEMILMVCNPSLYTVGSWIEFTDGSAVGSAFQVTVVNSVEGYIKVRNSCSDGETAIDGNASPGASISSGARFIVRGRTDCRTADEKVDELKSLIPLVDELCLDGISAKSQVESALIIGVLTSSDCESGSTVQPCLRILLTKELKDGSLKLGNLDETQSGDPSLTPLFADVDGVIVSGTSTPSVYKWLLADEEAIETYTSSNIASLSSNDYSYTPSNPPASATHAIVRIHLHVDDNPAGNIAVSFGNISPVQTFVSWGESYATTEVSVPIVNGIINYKIHATDGGSMSFSGSTQVKLEIVGYEVVTTL